MGRIEERMAQTIISPYSCRCELYDEEVELARWIVCLSCYLPFQDPLYVTYHRTFHVTYTDLQTYKLP